MFVITKDHISSGEDSDVGTMGPRDITDAQVDQLKAIAQGKRPAEVKPVHFKMYDDDGVLYYEGHYVETGWPDGEFEPLDCFGMPNAGCTYMKVRMPSGRYEVV